MFSNFVAKITLRPYFSRELFLEKISIKPFLRSTSFKNLDVEQNPEPFPKILILDTDKTLLLRSRAASE